MPEQSTHSLGVFDGTPDPATAIADALSGVLGLAVVERDVGFFELGADSFMLMDVTSLLREHWPHLRVVDLMANPTVDALAAFLSPPREQAW